MSKPRRALPQHIPREAGFGVADLHRLLVREFGDVAPSLPTLKRHVKLGLLKGMATTPPSKPPKFVWSKVRSHYQPRAVAAVALPAPGVAPAAAPAITQEQLAGAVAAALGPLLQPLIEEMGQMRLAVAGLASVRQTLMLKYDAAAGAALNRAEVLDEQLRSTRKLLDLDSQMRKVLTELSRISARLDQPQQEPSAG